MGQNADGWTGEEVNELYRGIYRHGHLNIDKFISRLPRKNKVQLQQFIRKLAQIAKVEKGTAPELIFNLNNWIRAVESEYCAVKDANRKGPLELALLLKMLSLDGVLENHPLLETADDVDYGACYRVLYQAVLGHPIQPVNKKTLDVLFDCFFEVSQLTESNLHVIDQLQKFLGLTKTSENLCDLYESNLSKADSPIPETNSEPAVKAETSKKPLRTYTSKRKTNVPGGNSNTASAKQVTVVVSSTQSNPDSASCSLSLDGAQIPLTMPKRMENISNMDEEKQIFEDITYNPLKIPADFLKNSFFTINSRPRKRASPPPERVKSTVGILFSTEEL